MSYRLRRIVSSGRHIMVRPHKIFTELYPPPPPPTIQCHSSTSTPRQSADSQMDKGGLIISSVLLLRMRNALDSWHKNSISGLDGANNMSQDALHRTRVFIPPVQHLLALFFQPVASFIGSILFCASPSLQYLPPKKSTIAHQSIGWKESAKDQLTLRRSLRRMQDALKSVHQHKVPWPDGSGASPETTEEYLLDLFQPVANLFNELQSHQVIKEIYLECVGVHLGDSIYAATFAMESEEKRKLRIGIPMVVALSDDIVNSSGIITERVQHVLRLGLAHESSPQLVLVTNFRDVVAFFPSCPGHPDNSFTRVSTTIPALALRAICAATIHETDITGRLMSTPDTGLEPEIDPDIIHPEGPPQDPGRPLLPDETIIQSHHRFSDFDKVTLVRDPERALQFFRWHAFVRSTHSKLVVSAGDTVTSNGRMTFEIPQGFKPLYSFDWAELPPDTSAHVKAAQRTCPLEDAGLAHVFNGSKSFQLKITGIVTKGTNHGFATVYRCELTSIDGNTVSTPVPLCLKLFDDRFTRLHYPGGDHGELEDQPLHLWFDRVKPVESMVLNEHYAYEKLGPVQGTVIPRYYGAYKFALPNGMWLYGILIEYISGNPVNPDSVRDLGPEREVSMIQSCRHAARVLDVADISQDDWHVGQIMLCTNPETNIDHCVFVDFAITRTTWVADEPVLLQNYAGCLRALRSESKGTLFANQLLWDNFGVPDDWDPVILLRQSPTSGKVESVKAKDPFTYLSFPSM